MVRKQLQKLLVFCFALNALQASGQTTLDEYIRQALDSNAVLKQHAVNYEQALISLRTAKSNYLPSVNFSGTYTTAKGGRYAALPLGQLMNPVYSTLNQLTGSTAFPQIDDEQINFLPTNYYDAYIRTAVPVLNLDIRSNKQIREQQALISELELSIYARELVKDVKVAYFNYQAGKEMIEVYKSNLALLKKNVDYNQALMREGKGLKASLLRSESEVMKMEATISSAENDLSNARAYFNFLLNRSLDAEIEIAEAGKAEAALNSESSGREELKVLKQAMTVQQTVLTMHERFWVPKVNAFLDLGSQGTDWEVSSKSAYYMVGISTSIPIYNGSRNKQQIRQTELNLEKAELQLANTEQQLDLAVEMASRKVRTALQNWQSSQNQLETAQAYFELVSGSNREGLTNQLEFLDASEQLTQAGIFVTIQYQQYLVALAELERANASYPLQLNTK